MNFVRMITFALLAIAGCVPLASAPAQAGRDSVRATAAAELVDINHATAAELRTLPGIGEAYSLAIVKHRPYKNKTQLRSKSVIPPSAYNKIKNQIIAKQ